MLTKLLRARQEEEGFTLIELLIVIIIIGILAAIAIPVFLNQRQRAWQAAVDSDARNAAPALESYFSANTTYAIPDATATSEINVSSGDTVTIYGNANGYCIVATGNGMTAYLSTTSGGVTTAEPADCAADTYGAVAVAVVP